MPSWVFSTSFVVICLAIWIAIGVKTSRRQIAATLARRPNPSRQEFLEMMASQVSPAAAAFLWDTTLSYIAPKLTPHPDDDLVRDLPILDEDWSMDWPVEFAKLQGFHRSNLPDWPDGWPATLRNYGRWLSMGPFEVSSAAAIRSK